MTPPITKQTEKFISSVQSLISSGKAETEKEIAERLGYNYSALNQIMNGHRNVPAHVYQKFTELYSPMEVGRNDIHEITLHNHAIMRVILRSMAEVLSRQRNEPVAKTLGDLEAALRVEIQQVLER